MDKSWENMENYGQIMGKSWKKRGINGPSAEGTLEKYGKHGNILSFFLHNSCFFGFESHPGSVHIEYTDLSL